MNKKKTVQIVLWGILGILLLAGAILGIQVVTDPYDCRIVEGVTIGGLDVGGMTKGEAREALKTALEETLYTQPLTVQLPEEVLTISPEDSGMRVSVRKAVNAAYAYGRKKEPAGKEIALLPYLDANEEAIRTRLSDYASRWDTELTQPNWELTGEAPPLSTDTADPEAAGQTLLLTLGIPSVHLDVAQAYGEILAAYNKALLLCPAGDFSITPEVQPEALPDDLDLDAIAREVNVAPVNDRLDRETYAFVPGSYGYGFDQAAAQQVIHEADWGKTVSIPMEYSEPEVLGEEAYYLDVLGSCETKHSSDENRNTNLRLVCEILDGLVIQPGEEFSYNATVGERTEERGFKAAGAYSGNRLVKDIGGGVCQGSTTLYNCALLADLEILERHDHGITVTYVPNGLDAAVNWATKTDFQFRNNFHFPIKIQAEVSDGYMKMKLLGTDEKDYYIEMKTTNGKDETRTYANSYKYKYDKETGELISKDLEARSVYYPLG